ncbi:sulfite exporter TauE/SafE family protein [Alcaligenes sp. SDU_A2]|uniref:sulfite exporter TauE/SafE family protein n=1 Tax=Alcaligenes sp. SDU_A2 TaxID=3136634 RepID=UPI002D09A55A|nr:sulfite exporter TauE/SafE family protein [Alcaligenes sp.]HRL27426.1 sulfite exporter TauE/SafE family protein [Alcaligenes sp.]
MDPVLVASLLALGAGVGVAAGLLGIGGGMILVPFLTFLLPRFGVSQELAVHASIATAMATILFTSLSSVRAHHKRGAIRWDVVRAMTPGLIVGGILSGGAVFAVIDGTLLALVFATFVLYSAYKMGRNTPVPQGRAMPGRPVIAGMGVLIGFVSGLLGAGGAFLSVPFMLRGNVPVRQAVATSAALGFFIALANSVGYIWSGQAVNGGQPGMLGYIYWPALLIVSAMSVLTAPVGASLAHRISQVTLKRIFAAMLSTLAVYMIVQAIFHA